jgi:hypothetical protein
MIEMDQTSSNIFDHHMVEADVMEEVTVGLRTPGIQVVHIIFRLIILRLDMVLDMVRHHLIYNSEVLRHHGTYIIRQHRREDLVVVVVV